MTDRLKVSIGKCPCLGNICSVTLISLFFSLDSDEGFPRTDEDVGHSLFTAVSQFMLLFPYLTKGKAAEDTKVYAFGESYGGSYVVSLAHEYLKRLEVSEDEDEYKHVDFRGIGIGNGFLSATDQSLYAEYFNSIG